MSSKDKQNQVRRYLQQAKHIRSREESKELERHVAEHKSQRKKGQKKGKGRRRDWSDDADDYEESERIAKAPKFEGSAATRSEGPASVDAAAAEEAALRRAARAAFCGHVTTVARDRVTVALPAGATEAMLSPGASFDVAVGDFCELEERGDGSLRVLGRAPRTSVLSRPDPSNARRERVIAANVDRAVVVVSVRQPRFRARLIDRLLVALARGGVEPIVCANKADLLDAEERAEIAEALAVYDALDVPAFFTSAESGDGIEELRAELTGRTVVFTGQSGVGKSSLLNALFPELELRTGKVRESDGRGRHTTTASHRFALDDGTVVIDTPGVRGFGLFGVEKAELRELFPDLVAHAGECRFADCSHVEEPGCAVQAAVESGALHARRYEAYVRMLGSL